MYDRLVWQNSIHWEHELLSRNGVRRNDFLTDAPTLRAQTIGNYGGRDWCVYGTGLEFEMKPHLTLNAGYDLSFNKNAVFHTGMAGVTYKF